jgi:hypothetical protein
LISPQVAVHLKGDQEMYSTLIECIPNQGPLHLLRVAEFS